MKHFVLALTLIAFPAALPAQDMRLPLEMKLADPADPQQEVEEDLGTQEGGGEMEIDPASQAQPVMGYIYSNSEIQGGVLYTAFDKKLDLESDFGIYARWGVKIAPEYSANLTYRHYGFKNSEGPGGFDDYARIRGLIAGIGYRNQLTSEFALVGNGGIGLMRWESTSPGASNDTSLIFAGEGGMTVRIHETLRFKGGLALDMVPTDFHQDSTSAAFNLSFLVGFEFGGY